jgi:hypothetical protein
LQRPYCQDKANLLRVYLRECFQNRSLSSVIIHWPFQPKNTHFQSLCLFSQIGIASTHNAHSSSDESDEDDESSDSDDESERNLPPVGVELNCALAFDSGLVPDFPPEPEMQFESNITISPEPVFSPMETEIPPEELPVDSHNLGADTAHLDVVVLLLQKMLNDGRLNRKHVFYNYIFDVVHQAEYSHIPGKFRWSERVLSFAATLEHNGGAKIINLLRGDGFPDKGVLHFEWSHWNLPFPPPRTLRKHRGGYETNSGVQVQHLAAFQALCQQRV